MMQTVLQLTNDEARRYFLRASRYCTIDLPQYFDFQPLLDALEVTVNRQSLDQLIMMLPQTQGQKDKKRKPDYPSYYDEVNYKFLTNKDGNFAWRPLMIINPVIYICLVDLITESANWSYIKQKFDEYQADENIVCYSLPIVVEESPEQLKVDTASSINNWWEQIEQQSIELALEYSALLNTDISDCYDSLYTHAIAWALHGKPASKENLRKGRQNKEKLLGDDIDQLIQGMSYGQTNGIPQGSVLMDFIAEMVLGYADLELSKKLNGKKIEFKILRYRDDYRIFAHSEEDVTKVAKALSEVLSDLNLRFNTQKTFVSNKIIRDVIKPDKLYWNEAKQSEKTLQRHLLLIHSFAEKYPNSGALAIAMSKFLDRLYPLTVLKEDSSRVLISILVDIAYHNPRVYSHVVACIGKILSIEPDESLEQEVSEKIEKKFEHKPNIGFWKVWYQRLTIKSNRAKEFESDEKLCQIAAGNSTVNLWEIRWLKPTYRRIIQTTSIFNNDIYNAIPEVPEPSEVKIFRY